MSKTTNFSLRLSGRSVIGDTLHEIGAADSRLFVCTPDIGGALKSFRDDFPERYIDTGITEQNVIGLAAGLALEGNIPVVMGMIPFLSMRACEQVRTDVCYQNLPVRIIGTGGGLTSGGGSTHNAMEDISIMKTFVNMTVLSIGDPNLIRDALYIGMEYPGPMYIRLAQGKSDTVIYEKGSVSLSIGKGIVARDGRDLTIFVHGELIVDALSAARMLEEQGIQARVVDMVSIKPLDDELVLRCIKETQNILVLEDHLMYGGLASSIADLICDRQVFPRQFRRMGIPQVYAGFGSGPQLREKYHYENRSCFQAALEMVKGPVGAN